MTQNPFQPPAHDEPAAPRRQAGLDPALARSIEERIKRLNRNSLLFGGPGLVLQAVGRLGEGLAKAVLLLVGTGLLVYGLSLYARMRNRSAWWGALGVLSCIGLVILLFLPKKCHNCGATTKGKTCGQCGAPAPM